MIGALLKKLARFAQAEGGTATIEFVIWVPAFITLFLSSVELGMVTVRHTMLERGLDMAVRDVRLGTGIAPKTHDELKLMICGYAGFIPNCATSLKLEMQPVDMRAFVSLPATPDCSDISEPLAPVRQFATGLDNEMMILRACVKFDPIFPTSGLGYHLQKDASGQSAMIAMSAFVQEPR